MANLAAHLLSLWQKGTLWKGRLGQPGTDDRRELYFCQSLFRTHSFGAGTYLVTSSLHLASHWGPPEGEEEAAEGSRGEAATTAAIGPRLPFGNIPQVSEPLQGLDEPIEKAPGAQRQTLTVILVGASPDIGPARQSPCSSECFDPWQCYPGREGPWGGDGDGARPPLSQ
jgi:hypothetical protein